MSTDQELKARETARDVLLRVQNFDIQLLPREKELGIELNFSDVVPYVNRIIALYKQISISSLEDFPLQQLNTLTTQANSDYNRLQDIIKFSQKDSNTYERRNSIIDGFKQSHYQGTFNTLSPLIGYSTSKSADFKRLESEARATIQTVIDNGQKLTQELEENRIQSEEVLNEIRKVAAEQGVSQQAFYFKEESEYHDRESEKWRISTFKLAWVMGAYALLSLFIHKIPFFKPTSTYDSIQLGVSKILVFAVISYMLYLSARNFIAHKHNAIINKHRQNALMTYKALVDAASEKDNKEIVLTHAASCGSVK